MLTIPSLSLRSAAVCAAMMCFLVLRGALFGQVGAARPAAPAPQVWVRVTLLAPEKVEWQMQVITLAKGAQTATLFAGERAGATAPEAGFISGAVSPWIDLSALIATGTPTVRFLFTARAAPEGKAPALPEVSALLEPKSRATREAKPFAAREVKARFELATAPEETALVRGITEHDPGNVIALRVPAHLQEDKLSLVSIREDTERRLRELQALKLPDGPRPRKIWMTTGLRANGVFYTDPAILAMDLDILKLMGMNGFVGGTLLHTGAQPGEQRKLAQERGLDYSFVFLRNAGNPPVDPALENGVRLDWNQLREFTEKKTQSDMDGQRTTHPDGLPTIIADLADEPAGLPFTGPEYQQEFEAYLRQQGLSPGFFGQANWSGVIAPRFNWRTVFTERAKLAVDDLPAHRLFYWSLKFWNVCNARLFAIGSQAAGKYAPGVETRLNSGPPWFYDYGTLPRGTDLFEFGRQRSTTMGFNEDWNGNGSARIPLETNLLLMDWSRAAARPAQPLLGAFITSDANRTAVKLRAFGDLARGCKVFYYFYYGPGYTFFDPYADKFPMVQGIAELNRDLGLVDDILWEARPPTAQVALLYSKSWPVWKEDDTEQAEQMMAYVSLLHAGVPVDIVSDEEVADGRFAARNYRALYVVNESIPAATAAEIEHWVRGGGRLWTNGWGGARDEYNTPTDAWNEMLGVQSRSWQPAGDLKRLGQLIRANDWQRPIFGREVTLKMAAPLPESAYLEAASPEGHRAYTKPHGQGAVQVVPWTAGKEYMDAAQLATGPLANAVIYPEGPKREITTGFAWQSNLEVPAVTSANQMLAYPLWTQRNGVVLLANYSGTPAGSLTVRFVSPLPVTKVRSLHHGELPITRLDARHIEVTLPMDDVTDILVAE